jgi:hypothetical protein
VSEFLFEALSEWTKEEQREQDIDSDVHKISLSAISNSAIMAGQTATFTPSITTPEQYEALTVEVWGAIKDVFQYEATLSELKTNLDETFSQFDLYAEKNFQFIPDIDKLPAYCLDLTEKLEVFMKEISAAYKYFELEVRDATEQKALTDTLMTTFKTIDALITEIQGKVLPDDWTTSQNYRFGYTLKTGDGPEFEEKAYGDEVTLNYTSQAAGVNNVAWSLLQYVISTEDQKKDL